MVDVNIFIDSLEGCLFALIILHLTNIVQKFNSLSIHDFSIEGNVYAYQVVPIIIQIAISFLLVLSYFCAFFYMDLVR